jgi:peptide deformylase
MFNKEYEILLDNDMLNRPCKKVDDIEEGIRIGKLLLRELSRANNGVGLAANQIGIDARVCVINVSRPVILVNPVVKNSFKKIFFPEGCLSFPGEQVTTQRWANIAVQADNHDGILLFGEDDLLECVCVQHEVDHLNGITMYERKIDLDKQS